MTGVSNPDRFESLRERIVDYLYGELDADGRAAIEAGMAESEDFRREVEALARTLRISRRALAAAHESVPLRVRASILAAAAQEAARQRTAAQAAVTTVADAPGVLDRVLAWFRQPWAYGVVGAACALTIFIFARGQLADRQAIDEALNGRLREVPDLPARLAPLVSPTEAVEPPAVESEKGSAKEEATSQERKRVADHLSTDEVGAELAEGAGSGLLGGLGRGELGQALKKADVRKPRVAVNHELELELNDAVGRGLAEEPALKSEGFPNTSSANVDLDGAPSGKPAREQSARDRTGFAMPPPGWSSAPRAPAIAPAAAPARVSSTAASPRPPAPSAERIARPAIVAPVASDAARSTSESTPRVESTVEGEAQEPLSALGRDELLSRADKLFAAERFAEAARFYRELLRRYPEDWRSARWRERAARAIGPR